MKPLLFALVICLALTVDALAATTTYDDLTAVIALYNLPCGYVTGFEKKGDNDWLAHCATHQSYRVFLDEQHRVRVVKP